MKERPILFSAPMVCAILEGRKSVTRRVIRQQPLIDAVGAIESFDGWMYQREKNGQRYGLSGDVIGNCPYGAPGERLWVRETFGFDGIDPRAVPLEDAKEALMYRENYHNEDTGVFRWRPSIFMPRWASRITLEVVSVGVERVKDVMRGRDGGNEILREGIEPVLTGGANGEYDVSATDAKFIDLWEKLNGPRGFGWDVNPWVWVVGFKRVTP